MYREKLHLNSHPSNVVNSGVDVFFAAHTHEATFTPLTSNSGALVVEAGNDGYLGRMDITVDKKRRSSKVIARDWTLLDVDDSVAEDPEMLALVEAARAPFFADNVAFIAPPPFFIQTLNQPLDTVIGKTDTLMDRKNAFESTFNNGWTDALRRETGTQVAFTPGFRMSNAIAGPGYEYEDATFATGEVTMEDAFRFFPMLYGIATEFIQPIDGVGPGAPAQDGNDCGYFGFCTSPDDTSGFGGFSIFGFGR